MKTKKLSLNKTWRLCLSMWRWIARQIRAGSTSSVECLKAEWLEKYRPEEYITYECFFCEYDVHHRQKRDEACGKCPGKLVDEEFACGKAAYHYATQPIAFYNKLVSLNRKRLKAKKK